MTPQPTDQQTGQALSTVRTAELAGRVLDELERVVVGRRRALELVLLGILGRGHILLEDVPGLGKTMMARAFSEALGLTFSRVQFTPDLLPADLTGLSIYDPSTRGFEFRPGPVFTQLLLADEINRTPPKTQAALLEAMAEEQVSSDGETRPLPRPFVVLATDNPIEYEGTYALPEAQLDRFLVRLDVGYPDEDAELRMLGLERRGVGPGDLDAVRPVVGEDALREARAQVDATRVDDEVARYVIAVVRRTRELPSVQLGASPRAAVHLLGAAKAAARLAGRDYVTPDDVGGMATAVLAHRLVLTPEAELERYGGADAVRTALGEVRVPR